MEPREDINDHDLEVAMNIDAANIENPLHQKIMISRKWMAIQGHITTIYDQSP